MRFPWAGAMPFSPQGRKGPSQSLRTCLLGDLGKELTSQAVESAQVQDSTLVSLGKSLDPCALACPLTGTHLPWLLSPRGKSHMRQWLNSAQETLKF